MKQTFAIAIGLLAFTSLVFAADDRGNFPIHPSSVKPAVMFAVTPPLSQMPVIPPGGPIPGFDRFLARREPGRVPPDNGFQGDPSLPAQPVTGAMPGPLFTFEGPSNADNPGLVNPPDPNGDVGPNHYVAMVNLTFAIYTKEGSLLFGPADIGTLWQGFPVTDCTDLSGDPIVFHDHLSDRWVLSQFTTRGPEYFNCVAVSTTPDPLGSYYLYAFSTSTSFPDYPKYALWPDTYFITTREFDPNNIESIGVYAIRRKAVVNGNPKPKMVIFHLTDPAYLVGDGLLAADFDGKRLPPAGSPEYLLGTMDDGGPDGAPFDGLNLFEAKINWNKPKQSTFALTHQIQIANFDTIFPCVGRRCIPQPGTAVKVDHLGYRQRPTWRLQYRNFSNYSSLLATQSVEAQAGLSGMRWWEIRNPSNPKLRQDATWQPGDGVHRWMGSIAMDKHGNIAMGYSVSNATDVFPGIRYAGRLKKDPLNQFSQGEAVLQAGSGSQTTSNNRWGDYTAMNLDPTDDCTFYYINEYYVTTSSASWQTRIGAFRFPDCQ